ncbi:MAG: HAD hydrolase family protein [bacterium]|nr:HAD hydrolase family protein [bacterium]
MNPKPTAIICLDLDGTVVEYDAHRAWLSDAVAEELNAAGRRNVAWCANSGRHAENQHGMILASRTLTHAPFAILAGERYIFDVDSQTGLMRARQPHNRNAKLKAQTITTRVQDALAEHGTDLRLRFPAIESLDSTEFVGWFLDADADPVAFAAEIRSRIAHVPEAQVLRNGRWVVVVHADFGKGGILETVAGELGVPRERILAVGDQHNDLDMLDGRCAAYVGCPADADPEVRAVVEQSGGWIADGPGPIGTCQLIRRFIDVLSQ